jgi:hypothetical protein
MGYPRKKNYREGDQGLYHCTVKCVRQAALCGVDKESNQSFEHRREWIRSQLAFQAEIFAVEVIAYAVMNNHLHTVVRTRPDLADHWTPELVARRWLTLYPPSKLDSAPINLLIAEIVDNPDRVKVLRARLCSLSWFNKILNERIARLANHEDKCTGHFWDGRFYCQKILDIPGAISCSVYVDLNPIRAGKSKTPEESNYTSIHDRISSYSGGAPKVPLCSISHAFNGMITLPEYLLLVDLTGRIIIENKASIPDHLAPILERLGIKPNSWIELTNNFRRLFRRIVGSKNAIQAESLLHGMKFMGTNAAEKVFFSNSYEIAA